MNLRSKKCKNECERYTYTISSSIKAASKLKQMFMSSHGVWIRIIDTGKIYPNFDRGGPFDFIPEKFRESYFKENISDFRNNEYYNIILEYKAVPAIEFSNETQLKYYLFPLEYKSWSGFVLIGGRGVEVLAKSLKNSEVKCTYEYTFTNKSKEQSS